MKHNELKSYWQPRPSQPPDRTEREIIVMLDMMTHDELEQIKRSVYDMYRLHLN